MPIFHFDSTQNLWHPTPLAAGPFAGLQGGAVAGLLTAEVEAMALANGWGEATSLAAWFIRPVPMEPLRTETRVVSVGGRVTIVDNTLKPAGSDEVWATVRVTLIKGRPLALPAQAAAPVAHDPERLARRIQKAPHGGPWFMDAMEVRGDGKIAWFKVDEDIVEGAGPLARAVGPADWTHGIHRPQHDEIAEPNPNLTVHLARRPLGEWLGIDARTTWEGATGIGVGQGILMDVSGIVGAVSMAVALTSLKPRN